MKKRSRLRNGIEYAAAVAALKTLEHSPRPLAERLARIYAGALDRALPRLRRTAMRNLASALPEADHRQIVDEVFASIGRVLLVLAKAPCITGANVHEWIRYEGLEHLKRAQARGRGVLIATAHLGNWELSAYAHALMSAPMRVVVRPLDNPLLDRLVARRRTLSGNRIIEKKDFARSILKALAANEAVGILIDQNASLEQGIFVDFFGVPACAGTGFAKIAARSGAAVVPGYALWSEAERRHVLRFYPEIEMTGDAGEDTRRLHAHLESVIREHPGQWLWIHRRWKTRPPGEPAIY